jgi:membrane associated rhomboid family serine protease
MGIESRDYFRDSDSYTDRIAGWSLDVLPPVCKWLLILNVVVFLLQIFVTRPPRREDYEAYLQMYEELRQESSEGEAKEHLDPASEKDLLANLPRISRVQEWLQLETDKVFRGQIWRLLTCAFCHDRAGIWHLLFNMLFLYWFGVTLESMYGSREFLLFYLTAAVCASLAYVALDLVTGRPAPMIGASGAVMAVTMLYAIHYPRRTICILWLIPIEVRWLVVLYVIFDLHPVLLALAGDRLYSGVAHAAHLGGLAFGFLYWKFDLRLEPFADRVRLPRWGQRSAPRKPARLVSGTGGLSPSDLDAQVDEILRKIHDHGEASLTDDERATLQLASQQYKNRNR